MPKHNFTNAPNNLDSKNPWRAVQSFDASFDVQVVLSEVTNPSIWIISRLPNCVERAKKLWAKKLWLDKPMPWCPIVFWYATKPPRAKPKLVHGAMFRLLWFGMPQGPWPASLSCGFYEMIIECCKKVGVDRKCDWWMISNNKRPNCFKCVCSMTMYFNCVCPAWNVVLFQLCFI